MNESKLYNALLKNQKERAQAVRKEDKPDDGETADGTAAELGPEPVLEPLRESGRQGSAQSSGEANADSEFKKERPFAGPSGKKPEWPPLRTEDTENPATLYDSGVTLGKIGNPKPWTRDELRERKIIYPGMPDQAILDAFREVRIHLRNRSKEQNFTVMISSLSGKDASVLTAFNLAASFALDAHTSALLVDCDPYNKDLRNLVSSHMGYGVTDFVSDPALTIKNILYPSGVDRLSVIPAGTQASSAVELFSSVRMKDLMSELRGRYPDRCIIINAPPLRDTTESRILERYSDQVVLGVPFGQITAEDVTGSVESLGSDKFSGLIFQE
jgi:Mrp family chromosome partitioning ATPase